MALTKIPSSLLSGVDLGDSVRVNIGSDNDLALFHTGSNGVIHNTTGALRIRANTLNIQDYTNEDAMITATSDGSVDLYHNNQKKFETTSTGVTVTGNLAVTGDLDITGNVNSYNVTDLDVTDKTITLGAGQTEANSGGSGIIIDGSNASMLWDESTGEFDFNNPLSIVNSIGGDTVLNLTGSYGSGNSVALLGFARSGGAVSGDIKYVDATTDMEIGTSTAHAFSLKTNGTRRMFISNSGDVGIGTNNPQAILHISGVAPTYTNTTTVFYGGTTNNGVMNGVSLFSSGNALSGGISSNLLFDNGTVSQTNTDRSSGSITIGNTTVASKTSSITFGGYVKGSTTFVERMRIDNDGNVGIGTSNPTADLSVGSTSTSSGDVHLRTTKTAFSITPSNTDAGGILLDLGWVNGGQGPMRFGINASEKMRIDSSGNVEVRDGSSLRVYRSGNSAYAGLFMDTGEKLYIRNSWAVKDIVMLRTGEVGIGTDNPSETLHVKPGHIFLDGSSSSVNPSIQWEDDSGFGTAGTKMWYGNADGYQYYDSYWSSGGGHRFRTSLASSTIEALTIQHDGKVGIGETSPDNILHIKTTASGGPQIQMGDGTNYGFINFDGTSLQISTQRDMVDGTWYNTSKSWGGINIIGGTGGSEITMTTATGPNTAPVARCKLDQNGRFYFGGTSSFAHNTYGHTLVAAGNSVPNGVVVFEDFDVSSGIGNTVLNLYFRDQDPATYAVYVDFRDGGGRVGSITHNDDGGGVTYNTTSDYRLKENVNYTWDALPLINQLKPARFNFIGKTDKTRQGFLAHEVSDIVPGSVRGTKDQIEPVGTITDNDGNVVDEGVYEHFCKTDEGQTWTQTGTEPVYQQLDYARLVPLLTKAIQEQQTIIDDLKTRIETLEE